MDEENNACAQYKNHIWLGSSRHANQVRIGTWKGAAVKLNHSKRFIKICSWNFQSQHQFQTNSVRNRNKDVPSSNDWSRRVSNSAEESVFKGFDCCLMSIKTPFSIVVDVCSRLYIWLFYVFLPEFKFAAVWWCHQFIFENLYFFLVVVRAKKREFPSNKIKLFILQARSVVIGHLNKPLVCCCPHRNFIISLNFHGNYTFVKGLF